jgi:hypothetical protein
VNTIPAHSAVRRRSIQVLAALLAMIVLAGCGSSGTNPNVYVKSVCTALITWRDTVQNAGAALQAAATKAHVSLADGKQSYQAFVASLLRATTAAQKTLKAAGVPDVDNGQQVSAALNGAFGGAQKALATAASQATLIPTTTPGAYATAAATITGEIRSALSHMSAISPRQNAQLRRAANKQPACSALKAAGG